MGKKIRGVDWDTVKLRIERGDNMEQVAREQRVTVPAIKCRSSRERWITPARVRNAVAEVRDMAYKRADAMIENALNPLQQGPCNKGFDTGGGVSLVSVAEQAAEYQEFVAKVAMEKVRRSLPGLKSPRNWREAATADTLARRALGLDKQTQGQATMIRIGGGTSLVPMDVDVLMVQDGAESDPGDDGLAGDE